MAKEPKKKTESLSSFYPKKTMHLIHLKLYLNNTDTKLSIRTLLKISYTSTCWYKISNVETYFSIYKTTITWDVQHIMVTPPQCLPSLSLSEPLHLDTILNTLEGIPNGGFILALKLKWKEQKTQRYYDLESFKPLDLVIQAVICIYIFTSGENFLFLLDSLEPPPIRWIPFCKNHCLSPMTDSP